MNYLILITYWILFWKKFLKNPYLLCTSELASTYFPHWLWMGRKWQATDSIYYQHPACIPFLSMFYPFHVLTARLSRNMSHDSAFRLLTWNIIGHYFLASIIAFSLFSPYGTLPALFGAITLTYAGYCIKPQTPSFVYTMTWMPGMLIGGPIGWISCGMAILGGYWPTLVYFLPVAALLNPTCLIGLIIGLPQIIPFAWYWPRSIRAGEEFDRKQGRVPWWKLKDLLIPSNSVAPTNGVHFPEVEMYMGMAILLIWKASLWWVPLIMAIIILIGIVPPVQRIPSRALYLLTLSFVFLTRNQLSIPLVMLQAWLLLRNASIYPSFPFSQWYDKPSRLYARYKDKSKWPHFSGYLEGVRHADYQGAFRLRPEFRTV